SSGVCSFGQPGWSGRSSMGKLKSSDKPFDISKRAVWEAYQRVKAKQGAAGVDGQTIAEFEEDLKGNLYRIWNRMSSGTYFPTPVLGERLGDRLGHPEVLRHRSVGPGRQGRGASPGRRSAVGAAVRPAMAGGPAALRRRQGRRPGPGHPPGVGDFTRFGEFVH